MTAYGPQGPPALGRGLTIRPGDDIAWPWRSSVRVEIDQDGLEHPEQLVSELHRLWLERTPVVVIMAIPDGAVRAKVEQNQVENREPWELGPSFQFSYERLAYLLTANNYSGRSIRGVQRPPEWQLNAAAVKAFGPRLVPVTTPNRFGDLQDTAARGRNVWTDGGPRRAFSAAEVGDAVVLHSESINFHTVAALNPLPKFEVRNDLTDDQKAAVLHGSGPLRVIAPAGSGKTSVLTERVRYQSHIGIETPLAVAYNKRAQMEMESRLKDLNGPRLRTFNSLGFAILRGTDGFEQTRWFNKSGGSDRQRSDQMMLDELGVRRLIQEVMRELSIPVPRVANSDGLASYIEAFHSIRLGFRNPNELEIADPDALQGLSAIFPRYCELLRDRGQVDFDGQIYEATKLLLENPRARRQAQLMGAHLLLDEFQDATPGHVLLSTQLAAPGYQTFVVGDPHQTIYEYSGASPDFMLQADRYFPGVTSYDLRTNFRCPPDVVDAVNALLAHNNQGQPLEIQARPSRLPKINELEVVNTNGDGMSQTMDAVNEWLTDGKKPNDIAILARVRVKLLPMQVALREAGVPCKGPVDEKFLNRTGVSAALAFLRIATKPDEMRISDIEKAGRRSNSKISFEDWKELNRGGAITTTFSKLTRKNFGYGMEEFIRKLEDLTSAAQNGAPAPALLATIRRSCGIEDALQQLDDSKASTSPDESHLADIDALAEVASYHSDPYDFETWLKGILRMPEDKNGVMLCSIHTAKALQWPMVVVYGADAGVMPDRRSDVEAERRVFHVAISRTQEKCLVVCNGEPSQFIQEMNPPEREVEFGAAPESGLTRELRMESGPVRTSIKPTVKGQSAPWTPGFG